jgi:AraC-like DNA-binding protein
MIPEPNFPSTDPIRILDRLLVTRLVITAAELKVRRAPYTVNESIPREPRLMLVMRGAADYHIDGDTCRLTKGQMILMPAWIRRTWSVNAKAGVTSLAWCRFSSTETELRDLATPIVHRVADLGIEQAGFQRLADLQARKTPAAVLESEGELKAILGRFLAHGTATRLNRPKPLSSGEQGIEEALQHLRMHFADPKALREVSRIAGLHPKYFRVLFRKHTGLTPSAYLIQLRMRAARYYQHESKLRVKEVASAVGYDDPFYFSRLYRRYWGHAPSDDRRVAGQETPAPPAPAALPKDGPEGKRAKRATNPRTRS